MHQKLWKHSIGPDYPSCTGEAFALEKWRQIMVVFHHRTAHNIRRVSGPFLLCCHFQWFIQFFPLALLVRHSSVNGSSWTVIQLQFESYYWNCFNHSFKQCIPNHKNRCIIELFLLSPLVTLLIALNTFPLQVERASPHDIYESTLDMWISVINLHLTLSVPRCTIYKSHASPHKQKRTVRCHSSKYPLKPLAGHSVLLKGHSWRYTKSDIRIAFWKVDHETIEAADDPVE